jgi:F0F1-type ATP synthase delta subunit
MSGTDAKLQKMAAMLAEHAAREGESGVAEVVEALKKLMEPLSHGQRQEFFRVFRRRLRLELKQYQLKIEYAGALSDAQTKDLVQKYSEKVGHDLTPVVTENSDLISGIRLQVGDNVYEASLAERLRRLSARV